MNHNIVLITGANGYLALHTVHYCLEKGWTVVGTVRSEKAASRVRSIFPDEAASGKVKLVIVAGLLEPEQLKPAFQNMSITAIINAASPLVHNPTNIEDEVLKPAIKGATAILEAAKQFGGGSVRRVVHVSSCVAVLNFALGLGPGKLYTADDWSPVTYEDALSGPPEMAYIASKSIAERSAWKWMEEHGSEVSFDYTSIVPAGVIGPHYTGALQGKETLDLNSLNVSSLMLWALVSPETVGKPPFSDFHMGSWTEARSVAKALTAAVDTPGAGGRRLLSAQKCHWQRLRDTILTVAPELAGRVDPGEPGAAEAARDKTYDMDSEELTKVLGVEYTSMEDAVRDSLEQLLEAEKKQKQETN